jgi:starch synthase
MRVLFVSSEIYPLAKTGGLADVSAALPLALARLGVDIRLLLPGYPRAISAARNKSALLNLDDFMGAGKSRLIAARMPDTGLPVWLVDCPALFSRGGGLYQNEQGEDWPDNGKRFAFFSHLAARLAQGDLLAGERADIVHINDWHAALVPLLLAASGGCAAPPTVLTVHNPAFQGLFPRELDAELALPDDAASAAALEFHGKLSFLKAGLRFADHITTVSPTYAQEILTPELGCGLDGIFRERASSLTGILNGADYRVWNPARDPFIPAHFCPSDTSGKRVCKTDLQGSLGLALEANTPLIAYVSRLTHQKMADVVVAALPQIMARNAQFAILGEGDRVIERQLQEAADQYKGRLAVHVGYDEAFAHRLYAGADILLHPSRFEPCGLAQLYALRYGTVPIVRHVGGLVDTIVDAGDGAWRPGGANGFAFRDDTPADMLASIDRTLDVCRQPLAWRRIQHNAMTADFSWDASARRYLAIYRTLTRQTPQTESRAERGLMMEDAAD